jgi:hypothetical protein
MDMFGYTDMRQADSAVIKAAYWSSTTYELVVHFVNGSMRRYTGVYLSDWRGMKNALSLGTYYNNYVRGNSRFSSYPFDGAFVFAGEVAEPVKLETEVVSADIQSKFDVSVTINIYVNGDPEAVAKAVEQLAPSFRAIQTRK